VMKNGFLSYLKIQLKRYVKELPLIIAITILLLGAVGLIAYSYIKQRSESDEQNLAKIGIVGDLDGSYLGIGISAIESLDASQYTISFENMTEEEAKEALSLGEIPVYVVVPENFVEDIAEGREAKLQMVGRGTQGIGGIIITELADVISVYINSSETAIYAMQDYAWDKGDTEAYRSTADDFFMLEANNLFARDSALEPILVGVGNGSTVIGYYACSVFLLFVMLMGISFCSIFVRQKKDINRVLYSQGVYAWKQVAAEYLCYLLALLVIVTLIVAGLSAFASASDVKLALWSKIPRELRWLNTTQIIWQIYLKWIPAIVVISSLQYLIYELVDGIVSSILGQFLTTIAMGYVCGLFYPMSFFPTVLQKVAAILPVKAAMDYCQSSLRWEMDALHLIMIIGYTFVFLAIAIYVRRIKLKK